MKRILRTPQVPRPGLRNFRSSARDLQLAGAAHMAVAIGVCACKTSLRLARSARGAPATNHEVIAWARDLR